MAVEGWKITCMKLSPQGPPRKMGAPFQRLNGKAPHVERNLRGLEGVISPETLNVQNQNSQSSISDKQFREYLRRPLGIFFFFFPDLGAFYRCSGCWDLTLKYLLQPQQAPGSSSEGCQAMAKCCNVYSRVSNIWQLWASCSSAQRDRGMSYQPFGEPRG